MKVSKGAMVRWKSSGGSAQGKVIQIATTGSLKAASGFEVKASEDNPAVRVQVYRDGKPTDVIVAHRMNALMALSAPPMGEAVLRLSALLNDPERIEMATRRVRTPEGARKYGKPIGSVIRPGIDLPVGKGRKGSSNPASGASKKPSRKMPPGTKFPSAQRQAAPPKDAPDADKPSAVDKVKKAARAPRAMSDVEYQRRADELSAALKEDWVKNGTDKKFSLDGKGKRWEKERARVHQQIVSEIYDKEFADVPSDGKALFSGGLGGAGKGTLLKSGRVEGVDLDQYGTVNPDDVKEYIAENFPDLVPESPVYESRMEASAMVHEESSHIAQMIAERAYAERKNIVWDITMGSEKSVQGRINRLRDSGYEQIDAVFIDIPVEVSVKRALTRHRRGAEELRAFEASGVMPRDPNGKEYTPLGGRFVPPSVIRAQQTDDGRSENVKAFEALQDQFDTWSLWDNSVDNRDAEKVREGKGRTPSSRQARARRERRQDASRTSGTAPKSASQRRKLEADRARLAEELGQALTEGFDPDNPSDKIATPEVLRIRKELARIRRELGLSGSVDRLKRHLLHL